MTVYFFLPSMPPPTPRETRRANRAAAAAAATAEPEEADDFGTPSGAGGGVDRQGTPASLADLACYHTYMREIYMYTIPLGSD